MGKAHRLRYAHNKTALQGRKLDGDWLVLHLTISLRYNKGVLRSGLLSFVQTALHSPAIQISLGMRTGPMWQ